jgi:dihydropteroate synthase
MGIVNVTPTPFPTAAAWRSGCRRVAHACRLVAEGADILDIGGESSRPGRSPFPVH